MKAPIPHLATTSRLAFGAGLRDFHAGIWRGDDYRKIADAEAYEKGRQFAAATGRRNWARQLPGQIALAHMLTSLVKNRTVTL